MTDIVLSGTGLFTPAESISNSELVNSFNRYVEQFNLAHAADIAVGTLEPLRESAEDFIVKASGIQSRHVMNKSGVLDVDVMHPLIPERSNDELSVQAEMAVNAAEQAMAAADKTANDIDAVFVACSNMQRAYPAVAVEVQAALGIKGFAFDMNVACSSAIFGLQTAMDAVINARARAVLVLSPEICSAHLNFRDRDSHFIFGDACTAMLVERADACTSDCAFNIIDTKLSTVFSSSIRNNFGFLNRTDPDSMANKDKLFVQEGRKVFKEVIPLVVELMQSHLIANNISADSVKRLWLHQANSHMNRLIATKILGHEPSELEAPQILDEYANTSSAGSVIALHQHQDDLAAGDLGMLCSFGAGYSVGNVILQKR